MIANKTLGSEPICGGINGANKLSTLYVSMAKPIANDTPTKMLVPIKAVFMIEIKSKIKINHQFHKKKKSYHDLKISNLKVFLFWKRRLGDCVIR
jgi:hypothetical protein